MASETVLELRLLGALHATSRSEAGERLLGKGKPVALLAFLSLAPARRASRERLATLLWSDGTSESARQNLRQTIWYIKRRLGDVLTADDEGVTLLPSVRSDVIDFLGAASAAQFAEALVLYQGDLAPDFAAPGASAWEEWAELERRRLRATFIGCVEGAARALLTSGRAGEAVRITRRARELAGDDQASWRLLLECLLAARDTLGVGAAVAQLEAAIAQEDLDAEPATLALLKAAKRPPGNGAATKEEGTQAEHEFVPDLVARESEFRTLVDGWESTRRGRGHAILLTGGAGLGKTRLLQDFAARIGSARGRALTVRAQPGNRVISGSLAAEIAERLTSLPGAAAISTESAAVLSALSPLVGAAFKGATPDRATGDDATRRRVSALGELLGVLSEANPLALFVDDMHWSDAESVRIVCALRARVEGDRVLLVLASRVGDELRSLLGNVDAIALPPLDIAGVAEFVGRVAMLPTAPWSRGFIQRLHEVSHGIPLFLIETLQRLYEDGVLSRRGGEWFANSAESLLEAMPPESALRARLESLSGEERSALVRLATLGRPIEEHHLEEDSTVAEWHPRFNELERRGFVSRSEHRISIWHDEVANGVLELATTDERLAAHAWVSRLLGRTARNHGDQLLAADHAVRSADAGEVTRFWVRALRARRVAGDERMVHQIARGLFGRALSEPHVVRAVRATPVGLRFGRRTWMLGAAVVAFVLTVPGLVAALAAPPPGADAPTFYFTSPDGGANVYRVRLEQHARWRSDEPIPATLVSSSESPVRLDGFTTMGSPLPDGSGWIAMRTYPDSGGDEIVFVDRSGRVTRPVAAAGDDWAHSPSPDGRFVAFATRRFDRGEHQSEIVIWERATNSIRRVTSSAEDEFTPFWSPDGTRLAYARRYQTRAEVPEICVMSVDGHEERCLWSGLPAGGHIVAWVNQRTLLLVISEEAAMYRLDLESGVATHIGQAHGDIVPSVGGGMIVCLCVDPGSRRRYVAFARIDQPTEWRPVSLEGTYIDTDRFVLAGGAEQARYLDRVALSLTDTMVEIGSADAVRVSGSDNVGEPIAVSALRFSSSDPSVAAVDTDGTVRARNIGRVWLRASAGGWRSDSISIRVIPSVVRASRTEVWAGAFAPEWRAFGDPLPGILTVDGRRALLPNGDGVYPSGVYLESTIDATAGAGVEIEAKLPVTKYKMQTISIALLAGDDSLALRRWDHHTGAPPFSWSGGCGTTLPSGEGGFGVLRFIVQAPASTGIDGYAPTPPDFYGERWHRIRLQLFPDGRCGLAVDGVAVAMTKEPSGAAHRLRFAIWGHAVGARLVVGRVDVWEGVRGDLAWAANSPSR